MLPIPSEKIRPIVSISIDQTEEKLSEYLRHSFNDYIFIKDGNRLTGYLNVTDAFKNESVTFDQIKQLTHPLDHACFLNKEHTLLDLYQVIGEAVTLVKNDRNQVIGYIKREDLLVEMFKDESQNTDLLKTILTSIPMGIFVVNQDRKIINCNDSGLKMIKRRAMDVINNPACLIFKQKHIDYVFRTGETLLNQIITSDNMGILADYSPIIQNNQEVSGAVIVVQDLPMVEKMAMEMEYVKNLNNDLNAVLSSVYDDILVLDENGVLLRCSEAMTPDYWDIDFKRFIGKCLLHMDFNSEFDPKAIQYVKENKEKYTIVYETKIGKKVLTVGTPILDEAGDLQRIIIALRDITETANLKQQLDQYKKELDGLKKKDIFFNQMVYRSARMEELMIRVKKVAEFSSTVLISGESGVGKEVVAKAIHQMGSRSSQPFIKLNCGAIPEQLLESELFGYVKGAFTGADVKGKKGYFEQANGGVIFLDEIGEMPIQLQVKLLRVLQENEVVPVGSTKTIPIDVQIVAATNRDLSIMIKEGEFREDLYYRLNVIPIHVPPLRERTEDIAPLTMHFLKQFNEKYHKQYTFMPDALNLLELYSWPGNIRELQNVIERLIVASDDHIINADLVTKLIKFDLSLPESEPLNRVIPMRQAKEKLENELIILAMKRYKTTIRAAEVLEISQSTVSRKYKKLLEQNQ
ncbi:sigma 54-interacting transcriptional regulator [Terrilactibacillus laevilacticus]|uniref:Sigma 54-interacting transcriptional regulator n=1 Tax=Terrilactibacillus laevilacticus TaxID=1380157 RepID=A0ABW5PPE9_9BACI|nr:sigma 54-interacting transcriptional regulator [Terrilactibacillus laevilacticus]